MRKRNFPDNITEVQKWKNLYACYRNYKSIVGTIINYNQYFGFTVDVDGINAKMSVGELSYWRNEEPEKFVGNNFSFIITEIDTYQKTLSVSRKRLVSNAKAGNILNGFIIDIEDNFITVDVGFACRILKRNLRDYFVKSIDDQFKFYAPIKLVLLNDFEKLKYTFASTKESDIWNSIKGKYKEKDIVSTSILSISDTGLMLDVDDVVKAFIYRTNLSEELTTRLSEGSLSIGEYIDVAISKHKDERHTVECSVRLLDKIKSQEMVNTFNSISQRGYVYEAEIVDIQRKYAKIRLGEYEGYIEKDSVSWNEIEKIEDILYVGQIVNVVYLADNKDKLTFGIKQLNPHPYDETLYELDLIGLLRLANVSTTDFIGIARNYGKYTFIEELYSCGDIEGKLLVDPFYGYNLRAIVMCADNVEAGKYYKIKLINLPPKNLRIERNQLFQFQCKIIEEVENPYEKDISEAFQRNTTNPTSNRRDAHLLKEIGKNMYSSKERMFFELIQNADDAAPEKDGVSINSFTKGDYLVFSHDGFSFDKYDFEAITSAAVGTKKANENKTGYKGIGFKSVFTDSQQVYICTNGYRFKFDKTDQRFQTFDGFYLNNPFLNTEEAKELFFNMYSSVRNNFDGVNDIPWQLEPIHVDEFPSEFGKSFMKSNVSIALRLGEKNIQGIGGYESAIDSIVNDPKFMLFLRKTDRIRFNTRTISREINGDIITLKNSFAQNKVERYERFDFVAGVSNEIFEQENLPIRIKIEDTEDSGNIRKAMFVDLEGEQIENIPMKIAISSSTELSFAIPVNEDGSISIIENNPISLFAFLPTLVKDFVFPFYINANFILDPPRQRVLGDSAWNLYLFKILAGKIVDWCIELSKRNDKNALNILPYEKFDESSSDISLLASCFNEAYFYAISNKPFILNEEGEFAKQEGIIIDKSELSDKISHKAFYKILGTNKRLVSPDLDSKILNKSLFSRIEHIKENFVLNCLEEKIDVKSLHKELNEEDYNGLLNWLSDIPNLSDEIINTLPCFSDGENILSFDELSKDKSIVLTDKTTPVKSILQKIGFDVYDNICYVAFDFSFPSEKDIFYLITKRFENNANLLLTVEEKLALFNLFLSFDGVAEGACSRIKLFKNVLGEIKPLDEMLAYRNDAPEWLHPYMICPEENFGTLECCLISVDDEYETIIESHIDTISNKIGIYDVYQIYKNQWNASFTKRLISNNIPDIISIVEQSGDDVKIEYIKSIKVFHLSSEKTYLYNSYEFRVLKLSVALDPCISHIRSIMTIDEYAFKDISLQDDFQVTASNVSYTFSLSKILPEYQSASSLGKIVLQFSSRINCEKLFALNVATPVEVRNKLYLYLTQTNQPINAEQYGFLMLYRKSCGGTAFDSTLRSCIKVGNEQQMQEIFEWSFENHVGNLLGEFLRDSYISYPCGKLYGKYIDSDNYTLETERVSSFVTTWASTAEKKSFLIELGAHDENSKEIIRRKSFKENKNENIWNISESNIIIPFLNWVKATFSLPIIEENQVTILKELFSTLRKGLIYEESDFSSASEWTSPLYIEWKKTTGLSIFVIDGLLPYRGIYDNVVLFKGGIGEFTYFPNTKRIYISMNREPASTLTDVYSQSTRLKCPFSKDDWNKLFLVSIDEVKEKDDEIARLKDIISKLKNGEEVEVYDHGRDTEKDSTDETSRYEINREARIKAKRYIENLSDDYDCTAWNPNEGKHLIKNIVLYKGEPITIAVTSSRRRKLYLHPRVFAELMCNPHNLLLNYGADNRIHSLSFDDVFMDNPNVNLIFDTDVISQTEIAELANKYMSSKRTCFVIENPKYSASDTIQTFGLNEKKEDGWVNVDISEDDIFNW